MKMMKANKDKEQPKKYFDIPLMFNLKFHHSLISSEITKRFPINGRF